MMELPEEVKDLFNWHKTHWKIIERIIDHEISINDLYAMIDDTEGHIDKCLNDLFKSGWCTEINPAGVVFDDRGNDVIRMSKFSYVALENMLKCMDMRSYR